MKSPKSVKLLAATLPLFLLGGCLQDDSSPEACAYDATAALDQGQFDKAISLLNSSSCGSAFTAEERNLNLAAAYIGRAGYDLMDLVTEIVNSEDSENALTQAFANNAKASGMNDLEKAKEYYKEILKTELENATISPTGKLSEACDYIKDDAHSDTKLKRNACFNNGLVASAKAGTSVSLLFGGQENQEDLNAWLNEEDLTNNCSSDLNQNTKVDSSDFTSCALEVANRATPPTNGVATACSDITNTDFTTNWDDTIKFSDAVDAPEYKVIKLEMTNNGASCMTDNDKTAYRLFTNTDPESMALTEGTTATSACSVAGTLPDWLDGAVIPCPVAKDDGTALTLTDSLVTAINEDSDSLISMLPEEDQDVGAIDDFKSDICTTDGVTPTGACTGDATDGWVVTEAALVEYLENN